MNDKQSRRDRIGDDRYYRTANKQFLKLLIVIVCITIVTLLVRFWQYELNKHYQTHIQKMQEVRAQILAQQKQDGIHAYKITVTQL